ncbi:MAG: hypothetical protein SGJ27_26625 [Candidatus Melainabacteria bacterium]|nr:hypothetical protein [Candidatus Melainabacteria bacterium]
MKRKNKLLHFSCIVFLIAGVSGLIYGSFYPFPNLQTRAITWDELQVMMESEKGSNIRKITCVCRFFPTPDTNDLIVELKTPMCMRTIASSQMPTDAIGTNCGILYRPRPLVNRRLYWLFEQARSAGVDLTLKAHAPVNGNKYVTAELIKNGKPTSDYAKGLKIVGPQTSKAPWLRD